MRKAIITLACATLLLSCAKAKQPTTTSEPAAAPQIALAQEGGEAPDFTLTDITGTDLRLSSLRGKYVILDFWGSWCGWCIKGMPAMKEAYQKYAGKLEILGVDCGDTDEKWKAAVSELQLPWKHVYCPRTSNVPKMYDIQGFPTKVIISPEGKIIKIVIGEDPEFYTILEEVVK